MNWKTWVPLILAIVLGVAAAKVARDQIMKNRLAAGPAGKAHPARDNLGALNITTATIRDMTR